MYFHTFNVSMTKDIPRSPEKLNSLVATSFYFDSVHVIPFHCWNFREAVKRRAEFSNQELKDVHT